MCELYFEVFPLQGDGERTVRHWVSLKQPEAHAVGGVFTEILKVVGKGR